MRRLVRGPRRGEVIGSTANSRRGFGSSEGNCLFCFNFDFEVSKEGVGEDIAECLHELGVHFDGLSPLDEVAGQASGVPCSVSGYVLMPAISSDGRTGEFPLAACLPGDRCILQRPSA